MIIAQSVGSHCAPDIRRRPPILDEKRPKTATMLQDAMVTISSTGKLIDAIVAGTPRVRAPSTREQNPQMLPGSQRNDSEVSQTRIPLKYGTRWPSDPRIQVQTPAFKGR
jgi:hypothetical protein